MLVYRDGGRRLVTAAALDRLVRRAAALERQPGDHEAATTLLIECGILEAGLVDALCPDEDRIDRASARLDAVSLAAARLFSASAGGSPVARRAGLIQALRLELAALPSLPWPRMFEARTPEGFAWYAVHPEAYLAAAGDLAAWERRAGTLCIGLRSIGTSLSAVVAAGLEGAGAEVLRLTLRPRGPPFERRPRLAPALAALLAARGRDRRARALVIDEGPGLSGSSLTGTAELLLELGWRHDQIVLMPAHRPDPAAFRSERARTLWPRLRVLHRPWDPLPPSPAALELGVGAWRPMLFADPADWPAVLPMLERRKRLVPATAGGARVVQRFAGLGSAGEAALRRAEGLAEAGLGPAPLGLRHGYLALPWQDGRPGRRGRPDPALMAAATRHLGHVGRLERTGRHWEVEPLAEMLRANAAAALGEGARRPAETLERRLAAAGAVPEVALDGRMLAQEWLSTPAGWVKTDAVDHHDDHLFPGPGDLAWDIAAFACEHALDDPEARAMAVAVGADVGDAGLAARLPFHAAAWAAFRLGQATLALQGLEEGDEAARWRRERGFYRARLAALLAAT